MLQLLKQASGGAAKLKQCGSHATLCGRCIVCPPRPWNSWKSLTTCPAGRASQPVQLKEPHNLFSWKSLTTRSAGKARQPVQHGMLCVQVPLLA